MALFGLFRKTTGKRPIARATNFRGPVKRVVKPDNTPLYAKRGWSSKRNRHQGYYRTSYGAWRGEIERRGDKFEVFIFKPPVTQIKKHSRWPCFRKQRGSKWKIVLAVNPKDRDISAIIFYVERIISESFGL